MLQFVRNYVTLCMLFYLSYLKVMG